MLDRVRRPLRIVLCRPAHQPLVRDAKFIRSYRKLGAEVFFVGNRRRTRPGGAPPLCTYRFAGFEYPYFSRLVPAGTLGYAAGVVAELRSLRPALVHAGDLEGLLGAVVYRSTCDRRCRIVYDIADAFSARYALPRWAEALIQWFDDAQLRWCDDVLVPQENRMHNFRFASPKRCHLVPNCPFRTDAPEPVPFPPAPPLRILLSGYLTWGRGMRQITGAARAAGGVELVAVGLYEAGVKEYLEASGIATFYPETSQAEVLRLAARCHVIAACYDPSKKINRQAAPNKVFDAMAVGRPVLLNREIEGADLITDRWQCGVSFGYNDVPSLAALLGAMQRDPAPYQAMGRRGRALFLERFNWESVEEIIHSYVFQAPGPPCPIPPPLSTR